MAADEHHLYRAFDQAGVLLYIGISVSALERLRAHRRQSGWFGDLATLTVQAFPDRASLEQAERVAIRDERPLWNVQYNKAPQRSPVPLGKGYLVCPELQKIDGPVALVGPALIYRAGEWAVLISHGRPGERDTLVEVCLGLAEPEPPAWADLCSSVLLISRADELSPSHAKKMRELILLDLGKIGLSVTECRSDLELAAERARVFPSEEARAILAQIRMEASC
jgi:hypothetical protein